MKKLLLILLVPVFTGVCAFAQDADIAFEQGSWGQIVETAKQRGRVIFVDCYTDWCGPCRRVAQEVFTQEEVADFFNANFVNAKIEMEKNAAGPMLVEKYGVKAYPTFLFIDPATEELLYVKLGSEHGYRWLIDVGRLALDPRLNKVSMERRYAAGDRDFELVKNYIKLLGNLSMPTKQAEVTEDYLDAHAGDGLFTEQTWEILSQSAMDPLSKHFGAIVRGRREFYPIAGQEEVEAYLDNAIRKATEAIVHHIWEPTAFPEHENAAGRHPQLIETLREVADYPSAARWLIFLETSDLARRREWDAMLDKMDEVNRAGLLSGRQEYDYIRYNMIPLGRGGASEEQLARAISMLNGKSERADEYEYEKNYWDLANRLKFMNEQQAGQ